MVDQVTKVADSVETERRHEFRDADILKEAVRESILTSPGSFLRTVTDVEKMSDEYWGKEIDTYTWVVIQRLDTVVGIAVARRPKEETDPDIDELTARFIESIWIAPEFRRSQMGERLVNYLMEIEREKCPSVCRFILWVFEQNKNAIRLYERMCFECVGDHILEDGRIELRYEYVLPNLSAEEATRSWMANAAAREEDRRQHDVTYRVLARKSCSSVEDGLGHPR